MSGDLYGRKPYTFTVGELPHLQACFHRKNASNLKKAISELPKPPRGGKGPKWRGRGRGGGGGTEPGPGDENQSPSTPTGSKTKKKKDKYGKGKW